MSHTYRFGALLWLVLLISLVPAAPVSAHAQLVRSEPPAGATLQHAPRDLVLTFSEDLDPSFSRVQLLNSKNAVINAGPGVFDPATATVLRLPLADLPTDSYTAFWHTRSATDGHVAEGSVPFGVGVAAAAPIIPADDAPDPALEPVPGAESALRWLALLCAAIMLGGVPFTLFVAAQASAVSRRALLGGGAALAASSVALLAVQAAHAASVPLLAAFGAPLQQLLGERSGMVVLARLALIAFACGVAWRLPVANVRRDWWLLLAVGAALLLTFSLTSHAAASGSVLALTLDWLHLAAMVAWLGGLVPLAFLLNVGRQRDRETRRQRDEGAGSIPPLLVSRSPPLDLIPRFSRLALVSVVVLALTGLYSARAQIGTLDLLPVTTYGRALLVKLALFGGLLALGAVNLLVLSRRLGQADARLARAFGRTVRAEMVVGAALLLAVGALTSVAPSAQAWEAKRQQGSVQRASVDAVVLTLRVAPARLGDNIFAVDVRDNRPGAQQAASKVLLRFGMEGMQMGTVQAPTATSDAQRYTARGSYLAMAGRWHVEVVLRRAGFDDVSHTFDLDVTQ